MNEVVPPSGTKARLLTRLGLVAGNPSHEQLYLAMKGDALRGYNHLISDRTNLKPTHGNHQGKWAYHMVDDAAIVRTLRLIESWASPSLREWYAHWRVANTPRNFVVEWFLWHAFRNRDGRNERKASTTEFHADDDDKDSGSGGPSRGKPSSSATPSSGSHYDPVRNGYVQAHGSR